MAEIPSELLAVPQPLIGFYGLDLNNTSHKAIFDSFSNRVDRSEINHFNPFCKLVAYLQDFGENIDLKEVCSHRTIITPRPNTIACIARAIRILILSNIF